MRADKRKRLFEPTVGGAGGLVATRPTPPSSYTVPGGTSVSSSATLVSALQSGTPTTIIVENGTYTNAGVVAVGAAHQVYARNLHGAEIQFGIVGGQFANTNGFMARGLYFHVTDPAKTFNSVGNHVVAWAANSQGWQLLDCKFLGNDSMHNAVSIESNAAYEGLIIRRCEARNFHENGFRVDSNSRASVPTVPPILEDLYAENCVYQNAAHGSNGTCESGFWVGCKAVLNRLWAHQTDDYVTVTGPAPWNTKQGWQGLWLGTNALDMTVNDLLVTGQITFGTYGYGPLNSDDASTITFNRAETTRPVNVGFWLEWDNPAALHHPNNQNVIVQDSYFDSACGGWGSDQGTKNCTVRRTTFVGQTGFAINSYLPGANNLYDTSGNNYNLNGGIQSGTGYHLNYPCEF